MPKVELKIPSYGMTDTDALVMRWLREPGDRVSEGDPLVDIETAKTEVTLESPASGVLGPHLVAAEAEIPPGTVLAWIEADGE